MVWGAHLLSFQVFNDLSLSKKTQKEERKCHSDYDGCLDRYVIM